LGERTVVLLDQLPEFLWDLIGPGQCGRVLVRVHLATQTELEALQAFGDELLQTRQFLDVLIHALVFELTQRADDFIELARIDVLAFQHAAQRVGVLRVLTRLAAQLTDVFLRQPATVPPAAPGLAAGIRSATIDAALEVADTSVGTAAVATALTVLTCSALATFTLLSLALTLLAVLALLTVLALAVLSLLALTLL